MAMGVCFSTYFELGDVVSRDVPEANRDPDSVNPSVRMRAHGGLLRI